MMKHSMKKVLAMALALCMILTMLPATVFAASGLAPAEGWTIHRQDEKVVLNSENSITITTQQGDFDQQASSGNPENYWLRTPADEDFTLTAKFSGGMTRNYHKAGILVYANDDTIASVVRRYHSGLTTTDTAAKEGNVLGMFQWLNAWGEACVKDPAPTEDVWLKLEKVGDQFTGYYRFSETDEWTILSTLTNATVAGTEDMKIGVFAVNGTGGNALDVTISDFTYQGADDEEATLIPFAAVTEEKVDIESLTLNSSDLTLLPGETASLTATIVPSYATDKNVVWTSSNDEVATVDGGTVTAVGEGEATITATADGLSAQCAVKVVDVEGSNSIYVSDLDWNDANIVEWTTVWRNPGLDKGVNNSGTIDIGGVNFPKGIAVHAASEVNINIKDMQARYFWAYIGINDNQTANSNAHFIVQVDGEEVFRRNSVTYAMDAIRVLVEIPEGAETLTLITDPNGSNNSDHTCWADAKILLPEGDGVAVANLTAEAATERTVYGINETVAMSATVSPVTASNKAVTWSVEPADTASITEGGVLSVTAPGTYTVTATAADGAGASDSLELTFGTGNDWILDETTKSGWIGTYGSDGWVLSGWDSAKDVSNLPYYIESIDYIFQDRSGGYVARTAADSTATGWDVALPHPDDPDGTRKLAYQFDDKAMTVRITANDDYEHQLTIYSVSENDRSRKQTLIALDPETGLPISNAITTGSMHLGKYYTISFTGSIDVLLYNENYKPLTTNVVVNGIFFDTEYPEGDIAARDISVAPADGEVVRSELGQVQMEATVWPVETTDKSVTWSVDNTEVATVDDNGVVTILKPGAFNVTATAKSNEQVVDTVSMVAMDNADVPEQAEIQMLGDAFAMIQNSYVRVLFNLETGYYSVYEQSTGLPYVLNAYFQVNSEKSYKDYAFTASELETEGGKTLRLTGSKNGANDLVLDIGLEDNTGDILMRAGITNKSGEGVKVMQMYPMVAKYAEKGGIFVGPNPAENHALLTGEGNWAVPQVKQGVSTTSKNNLMLSYRNDPELESFLIGQLTTYSFQSTITTAYNETASFVNNGRSSIDADIRIYDNTGKLVDDGDTYVGDVALFNFTTKNPYDSLDAYAWRQAEAMEVDLIDFDPYVYECLWYVNWYTSNANNADFAVQEVKDLYEKGLANYAIPNIRVEPDTYTYTDTEQLWWDDEHWLAFGHLTETYPTVKDWLAAMHALGAEGGLYMQASYRSNDYCEQYPEQMINNDYREGPDYTDPDFQAHMAEVYTRLKEDGLKSLFFDYTGQYKRLNESTGKFTTVGQLMNLTGGFEDEYATAVEAYRLIYGLAKKYGGSELRVTENIWNRTGEDVAIGLIDIQRNIGDTNEFNPEIAKVAINQWYRHRKTKLLYSDVKVFDDDNIDLRRAQITGTGFFFGKTTLGESVNLMSDDKIQDIGKVVPFPVDGIAARPVGLFEGGYDVNPEVLDYEFDSEYDDHILLFWNQTGTEAKDISADLGLGTAFGGVGLDVNKTYEVWDFWNWEYIGTYAGSDVLTQNVRPDEMRTMAVREVREEPYLLSTNRHILQGTAEIDVKAFAYDAETTTVTGTFDIIGNDTYKAIIALGDNELLIDSFTFDNEAVTGEALLNVQNNYIEITLDAEENQTVNFTLELSEGNVDNDVTAPGAVTGLTASADDFANITLSWNESIDDNAFVQVSYEIYGGATADEAEFLATTAATTFTDITARPGEFWYKVRAVDGMGNATDFAVIQTDAEVLAINKGIITMTAGSSEPDEGPENAIDGNTKTLWHTNWDGTDRANMWLDMAFAEPTLVNAYDYTPRTTTSRNGVITQYELHASTDGGATYEKIAEGTWSNDASVKTIRFEDITVTNLKLVAVASVGNFASAAEVRAYRIVEVESIVLRQDEITLINGESAQLEADIYPTNLSGETLTYTSDNEAVAKVDANGIITTLSAGTANITVAAANGVSAVCVLTVEKTELEKAQEAAVAELEDYRAALADEDYRPEQIEELAQIVADGTAAIDTAASIEDVTAALDAAIAALDAVPTDAELSGDELAIAVAAAKKAQAAAEAAQKAAEEAQAAAEAAQAQAAEDKAAAEAAQAAAEAAQKLAEDAQAAAEAAKTAAEEQNAAAAQEAAAAATSAAAAAEASASAAKAAETAQAAQTAAEAAQKEAEAAADAAAEDKTAAEAAASAAETAKAQAEAAKAAAEKAQAAAEDAADAAEESNTEAAKSAAEAADSAAGSAASAAAAAESAKASAASAKAAAESQKAAEEAEEEARRLAEQAEADRLAAEKAAAEAEKLKADAEKAAAESALNLEKLDAELALNEYYEELKADATATEKAALSEAAKAARAAVKAAESSEAVAEAVEAGRAALDNALCLAKNFTDVDLDEWYHDAIDFVLKEGIMSGNGDGTFTPEASLTRAMLVQILYNIEGRPAVETDKSFSDVEADDWYYDAIMWAAENDIVLGYEDGSFGAEDDVTREQMVTILYRYAGEPEVTAEEIIFADSDEISDWAVEAVLWAYENKIVQGVGSGLFDPAGASQRAAAAQVMMNYFKK